MADTWKNYDKGVQEALKDNPSIINAINNMKNNGYEKETAQRITGAPFEVVDKIYNKKDNK